MVDLVRLFAPVTAPTSSTRSAPARAEPAVRGAGSDGVSVDLSREARAAMERARADGAGAAGVSSPRYVPPGSRVNIVL